MPHDLKLLLSKTAHEKSANRSLPAAVYTCDRVLAVEQVEIFGRDWIGVGRSDRWRQPGDYVALNIADTEIVIVRNADHSLKAFSNVCTHRGTRLLDPGDGRLGSIVCPFHRWTFALDGALMGAPGMQAVAGFNRAEYCLERFRVQEYHGFVFVCLSSSTPDVERIFEDFDQIHRPWPLAQLISTRRREFDVACNWKLFLEVFNEYYHLPAVHPDSIANTYAEPDPMDEVRGQFTTQFGLTTATASLLSDDQQRPALPPMFDSADGEPGRCANGTRYTWCFPNMTFAASNDCLWMYDVLALASNRTRVGMTVCFEQSSVERADFADLVERYYRRLDVAIDEDIAVLARQQAGLSSAAARQGPFSPLEPSVARFASWYASTLTARLADDP